MSKQDVFARGEIDKFKRKSVKHINWEFFIPWIVEDAICHCIMKKHKLHIIHNISRWFIAKNNKGEDEINLVDWNGYSYDLWTIPLDTVVSYIKEKYCE